MPPAKIGIAYMYATLVHSVAVQNVGDFGHLAQVGAPLECLKRVCILAGVVSWGRGL